MIQTLETPLGRMIATWTSAGLYSFTFSNLDDSGSISANDEVVQNSRLEGQLSEVVEDYFEFGTVNWPLERLDWTGTTRFHQALLSACYAIPSGQTRTYGELAAQCGSPLASRAAGQAMARNRWPIIIPCHRVLGSTGKLTGYSGSGGLQTKLTLLRLEACKQGEMTFG